MSRREFARAAGVVMALAILAKLIGFVRDQVVAVLFGATAASDAFFSGQQVPLIIMAMFAGALGTVPLPVFAGQLAAGDEAAMRRTLNNLVTLSALVLVAVSAAGVLFAAPLVRVLVPGFQEDTLDVTVTTARIIFPAIAFLTVGSIWRSALNTMKQFAVPALTPVVQNGVAIVALLLLFPLGIPGLALATAAGMTLQALVMLPSLRRFGLGFRPILDLGDPALRRIWRLSIPVLAFGFISPLYTLVDRALASHLTEGSISALAFADKFRQIPLGLFVAALSTVVYPAMADRVTRGDGPGLKRTLATGLKLVSIIAVPAAIGLLVLREPIIRLLLEHGKFDPAATAATAAALLYYALGIIPLAANSILTNVFYSLQDSLTPVFIIATGTAANIALDYALVGPLGHAGLALANSLAALVTLAGLYVALRRRLGRLGTLDLLAHGAKVGLGTAGMALAALALATATGLIPGAGILPPGVEGPRPAASTLHQVLAMSITIGGAVLVYAGLVTALGLEEARLFWAWLGRKLGRIRKVT